MPTSNASEPVRTSANSPDTLPLKGYTVDQLANFVIRQLGGPVWNVELTKQQILDHIQDALGLYSQYVPNIKVGSLQLVRGQSRYLVHEPVGLGIAKIDFVEPNPVPTEIFYGNLINPAPLFRTGLDEYDVFLRWRKTWQRVTSIKPDWFYDDVEECLYIHNPIERYQAGIFCYWPHERTEKLSLTGADWVKRYAVAPRARNKEEKCLTKWCRNRRPACASGKLRKFCWKCHSRHLKENRPWTYLLNHVRLSARKRHIPFGLTVAEFKNFCLATDYHNKVGLKPGCLTVDRIDRNKGYYAWNIQVLSFEENSEQGADNSPRTNTQDNSSESDPF